MLAVAELMESLRAPGGDLYRFRLPRVSGTNSTATGSVLAVRRTGEGDIDQLDRLSDPAQFHRPWHRHRPRTKASTMAGTRNKLEYVDVDQSVEVSEDDARWAVQLAERAVADATAFLS